MVTCIAIKLIDQLVVKISNEVGPQLLLQLSEYLLAVRRGGWRSWGLVLLAVGLLPGSLCAQTSGEVSGMLLDQATRQPLPFANVLLLRLPDSTLVGNTQTAENGTFVLANLALNKYLLRVEALGYQSTRRFITLSTTAPVGRLGTWLVAPAAVQLGGVVVQGEKAAMINDLGKTILNVGKDLNSAGGTAADVLQKVPSVAVNDNGQVSLRGN